MDVAGGFGFMDSVDYVQDFLDDVLSRLTFW